MFDSLPRTFESGKQGSPSSPCVGCDAGSTTVVAACAIYFTVYICIGGPHHHTQHMTVNAGAASFMNNVTYCS